jgi:hypothetical protein
MSAALRVDGLVGSGEKYLSLGDCRAFGAAHQVELDQEHGGPVAHGRHRFPDTQGLFNQGDGILIAGQIP